MTIEVGQMWKWHAKQVACGKWCHRCGNLHVERMRFLRVVEVTPDRVRVENNQTKRKTWIRVAAFGVDCTLFMDDAKGGRS